MDKWRGEFLVYDTLTSIGEMVQVFHLNIKGQLLPGVSCDPRFYELFGSLSFIATPRFTPL